MLHAIHYFANHGLTDLLPPFELFTLFFSALAVHFSHPGLSSEFLIKTRHPRALRYNDQAVVENYNMSRTAMMLMDPECNFLLQWEASRAEHGHLAAFPELKHLEHQAFERLLPIRLARGH